MQQFTCKATVPGTFTKSSRKVAVPSSLPKTSFNIIAIIRLKEADLRPEKLLFQALLPSPPEKLLFQDLFPMPAVKLINMDDVIPIH